MMNEATSAALQTGAQIVFYFFIYGFLGWVAEVAYAGIAEHKLVNRGFLCGPICPIYGFGMLALVGCVKLLPAAAGEAGWLEVFIVGMLVTTAIELVGGWLLFKIFHTRWWDYSNLKYNLGGYICPQFSLLWGLGSMVMVKLVHPLFGHLGLSVPLVPLLLIDAILLLGFGIDVGISAASASGLNEKLREIDELRDKLRATSDKLTDVIGGNAITFDTLLEEPKLQLTLAAMESRDNTAEARAELERYANQLRAKLDAIMRDKLGTNRLVRAFPDMKSDRHGESIHTLQRYARQFYHTAAHTVSEVSSKMAEKSGTAKADKQKTDKK